MMASKEPPKLVETSQNQPKSDKLGIIAYCIDSLLSNMKLELGQPKKKQKLDSSVVDAPNLECKRNNMLHNVQKSEAFGKKQQPTIPDPVKQQEANFSNSQNARTSLIPTKKCIPNAGSNAQKKAIPSTKNLNALTKIISPKTSLNKQTLQKLSLQQKPSPKKMQVVYKENDQFVSKSLTAMLKNIAVPQGNAEKRNTNKGKYMMPAQGRKRTSRLSILANPTNRQKTISQTSPINTSLNLPAPIPNTNSNQSKPVKSSVLRKNENNRLNGATTEVMEKHIRRNGYNLKPMSNSSDTQQMQGSQSQTRSSSLNTNQHQKSQITQNRTKPNQKFNKRLNQNAKAKPKAGLLNQRQIEIINRIHFQNARKPEQIGPKNTSQNLNISDPNRGASVEKTNVTNKVVSKTEARLKFMKNTENRIRQKTVEPTENTAQVARETKKFTEMGENAMQLINEKLQDIIEKIKEENINRSQLLSSALELQEKIPVTINLKLQQLNQTATRTLKPINPVPSKTTCPAPISTTTTTQDKSKEVATNNNNNQLVSNHKTSPNNNQCTVNQKTSPNNNQCTANQKTSPNNNQFTANQKTSPNNNQNTANQKTSPNNNQKTLNSKTTNNNNNQPVVNHKILNNQVAKIASTIKPCVKTHYPTQAKSRHSIQSCVVPKASIQCYVPNKKLSCLTPMEIVQDFINLVNRAKRERKTFTVCGNFQAIRRAFQERGWIEKVRINLIDDRDAYRKIESLSNFELVEGIKDRENGDKYRRIFLSKLLAGHQVDFYWDYMTNPFSINNDRIKRTIINRFPFGATRPYTSKIGLCETLREAYWYYIEGYANILYPRTYNLSNEEEIIAFTEDFRRTAVVSLLQWVAVKSDSPNLVISPAGQIPTSVFNFATSQCYNYLKIKEHKDIDELIPLAREYEWDIFLEKFYKIIHQGNHFKETEHMNAPLIIDQSKYILNKLRKCVPNMDMDGIMNLWLLKPSTGSRGCGIHVCRTLKYTLETVHSRKDTKYVIQKYIERPLLIHNTKFDIRQWFLVTCMPNLHVWIYKDCYLRFSSQMYDLSKLHESIHLTNNSIQCRYKNNQSRNHALPDQNMWHSDTFRKYLSDIGHPYAWRNVIYKGMKECLIGLFMLCQDKLTTRINSFELCGADFMLAEDFRPYLIEINSRPALYASTRITARMCPQVLEDVVKVTIDYARNPRASTGNFELIYKDTFNYMPPKNLNSMIVDGISHLKFAGERTSPPIMEDPTETITVKQKEELSGNSIQKILNIDPLKVRKDVKNTLEKILAIIHTDQKTTNEEEKDLFEFEKNKHFRMMLSEFVDIITCVTKKPENNMQV